MLSINNTALTSPISLAISLTAPKGADYLSLLQVRAGWQGLSSGQVEQLLMNTRQSFTLGCLDPRTGAMAGFTVKLSKCEVKAAPGSSLYSLDILMEEIA